MMQAVTNGSGQVVARLHGDVVYDTAGNARAFVQGPDVVTFCQGRVGGFDGRCFRDVNGQVTARITEMARAETSGRRRLKRWRITPWLSFYVPAPRRAPRVCCWAIWHSRSPRSA